MPLQTMEFNWITLLLCGVHEHSYVSSVRISHAHVLQMKMPNPGMPMNCMQSCTCQKSNPGHLWPELPVLCHWAMTAGQPPTLTILYMYCAPVQLRHSFSASCAVHTEDCMWELVVVRFSWLSGRALVAKARGVLGSTSSSCWPFHFLLYLPHDI